MSRIRGKHTAPERELRRLLWRAGLRYRLHARTPVGRPDLVFQGPKVAVFVDGCFWHGCPEHYVRPRSSPEFWAEKLATNVRRDVEQTRRLEALGWRVFRLWEHEVLEDPHRAAARLAAAVRSDRRRPGISWRVIKVVEVDPKTDQERRFLHELRDLRRQRTITQKRSTKKWRQNVRSRDRG